MLEDWKWFGSAGHFICAQWCRFHLCTLVGSYLISTVGEYVPDETVREIHCEVRGIKLEGRGDARLADYMKKVGFQEIGYKRTYETMVFHAGEPCRAEGCNCGLPRLADACEIECLGANDAGTATANHLSMCHEYDQKVDEIHEDSFDPADERPA